MSEIAIRLCTTQDLYKLCNSEFGKDHHQHDLVVHSIDICFIFEGLDFHVRMAAAHVAGDPYQKFARSNLHTL